MGWGATLIIIFLILFAFLASGLPVAAAFMAVVVGAIYLIMGGVAGLTQLISSIYSSLVTTTLLPIPIFILMGEILFLSGFAKDLVKAVDNWFGKVPGRLGIMAVITGTIFAAMTSSSIASTATLGSVIVPEMRKRNYKDVMIAGPILGGGCLAAMIPPSGLAVLTGAIAEVPIGTVLIAAIVPGVVLGILFISYIIIRCKIQPDLAPTYDAASVPLKEKLVQTAKHVLPVGFLIFLVIGLIMLGVATPEESASTGTVGALILVAIQGRLKWKMLKKAILESIKVSGMILLIISSATAFSQILAFSGVSKGIAGLVGGMAAPSLVILGVMMLIVFVMGMFMSQAAIMMITLPVFMPIVKVLGFNTVVFCIMFLINIELSFISPPYGGNLFAMQGVVPDMSFGRICAGAFPFIIMNLLGIALLMFFPQIALWLPSFMM